MRKNNKMIINDGQFQQIKKALYTIKAAMNVEIYADTPIFFDGDEVAVKFTVNWSCFGGQSIPAARNYGEALLEAVDIAEKLESMNFVVKGFDKYYVSKGRESFYNKTFPYFVNAIRYMRPDEIKSLLDEVSDCLTPAPKDEKEA